MSLHWQAAHVALCALVQPVCRRARGMVKAESAQADERAERALPLLLGMRTDAQFVTRSVTTPCCPTVLSGPLAAQVREREARAAEKRINEAAGSGGPGGAAGRAEHSAELPASGAPGMQHPQEQAEGAGDAPPGPPGERRRSRRRGRGGRGGGRDGDAGAPGGGARGGEDGGDQSGAERMVESLVSY
jgi:hypothetical protein